MASNEFSLQMAVQQIQLQQKESMERMDVLKEQHKQWQAAVEDLLARVNSISLPQVSLKTERPEPPSGELGCSELVFGFTCDMSRWFTTWIGPKLRIRGMYTEDQ